MKLMKKNIITYTVNKNITNNLYIAVQNGEVVVKAPWYFTSKQIQEIVEEKRKWILQKMREYEENKQKEYIQSEIVKILGEDCKVKVNYRNLKKPVLTVEGKNIKISLPNKYKKANREEILAKLIEKLYDYLAETEIERAMEKTRIQLGFAPEDYKIQRMQNKMADCSQDQIIYINPDIVKYDREIIDYIIIHQYCHLKYKTHSKGFWQLLQKNYPNYQKLEKRVEKINY